MGAEPDEKNISPAPAEVVREVMGLVVIWVIFVRVMSSSTSASATTEDPDTKLEAVKVSDTKASVIELLAKDKVPATLKPPERDNEVPCILVTNRLLNVEDAVVEVAMTTPAVSCPIEEVDVTIPALSIKSVDVELAVDPP